MKDFKMRQAGVSGLHEDSMIDLKVDRSDTFLLCIPMEENYGTHEFLVLQFHSCKSAVGNSKNETTANKVEDD